MMLEKIIIIKFLKLGKIKLEKLLIIKLKLEIIKFLKNIV